MPPVSGSCYLKFVFFMLSVKCLRFVFVGWTAQKFSWFMWMWCVYPQCRNERYQENIISGNVPCVDFFLVLHSNLSPVFLEGSRYFLKMKKIMHRRLMSTRFKSHRWWKCMVLEVCNLPLLQLFHHSQQSDSALMQELTVGTRDVVLGAMCYVD